MKKKKRLARLALSLALLTVLGAAGLGGAYAWNVHKAEQENNLTSRNESVQIVETFPDDSVTPSATKTKEVSFKNTGTASAFVRMAYTESWETTAELLEGDTNVTKNWTASMSSDWVDGGDGWYYYKKVLPAGATTDKILTGVTFPATVPADADYNLSFQVETVQASDEDAVNTAATAAVFGKTATVTGKTVTNGALTAGTVSWA